MKRTIRRRRAEGKTDYKSRLALLKSEKPRLVVRKSNRYITAQIVSTDVAQDKIIITVTSKDLLSKGWPKELSGSLKSIPAAYLTGFLLGKLAKGKVKEAILDIGLNRNVHKSRMYAALKGALDAGLNVPHNEAALSSIEEIKSNEKVSQAFDKVEKEI